MIDLMGPAPTFDTPLAVLEACHRRIERRLDQLMRVAERLSEPDPARHPEALQVLADVRRHFQTAGMHHTADEDESLFPMLKALQDDSLNELIAVLEEDHREIDSKHEALDAIGDRLQARVDPADVEALRTVAADLRVHYERHIRHEEATILPRAASLLTPEQLGRLGGEMQRRRGL